MTDGAQLGLCEVEVYGVRPACPEYCSAANSRVRSIENVHQLAMVTNGFQQDDCVNASMLN
eukprot:SAG22_NODE_10708_length_520_cov_0.857482_1_plen_60_part_10